MKLASSIWILVGTDWTTSDGCWEYWNVRGRQELMLFELASLQTNCIKVIFRFWIFKDENRTLTEVSAQNQEWWRIEWWVLACYHFYLIKMIKVFFFFLWTRMF